jgi:type II secretory pathway component PulC
MSSLKFSAFLIVLNLSVLYFFITPRVIEPDQMNIDQEFILNPIQLPIYESNRGVTYSAIIDFPLFNKDRVAITTNPLTPNSATQASTVQGEDLKLVGVILAGESKEAFLLQKDGQTKRLAVGEVLEGWKLIELSPNIATITREGYRKKLILNDKGQAVSKSVVAPRTAIRRENTSRRARATKH